MTVHFLYQFGLTISDLHKSQAHIVEPNVKLNFKTLYSNLQSFDTKWSIFGIKMTLYSKQCTNEYLFWSESNIIRLKAKLSKSNNEYNSCCNIYKGSQKA